MLGSFLDLGPDYRVLTTHTQRANVVRAFNSYCHQVRTFVVAPLFSDHGRMRTGVFSSFWMSPSSPFSCVSICSFRRNLPNVSRLTMCAWRKINDHTTFRWKPADRSVDRRNLVTVSILHNNDFYLQVDYAALKGVRVLGNRARARAGARANPFRLL